MVSTTHLLAGFEAYCRARVKADPKPSLALYHKAKRQAVSTLSITPADMGCLRTWLKPGEAVVMEDFGRLMRICTGVHDERLGKPAQPATCRNCGAPRVEASRACDYCGSV